MKFGRSFSIFILLFILPSSIFAVLCPSNLKILEVEPYFVSSGSKNCDDACVIFGCQRESEKVGAGCPKDFYDICSEIASSDIDFVKSKSPNKMVFQHSTTTYVSGCGDESDGKKCIDDRTKQFSYEMKAKYDGKTYKGELYWNYDPTDPSDSNAKNGAFKLIGIIAIGWIFAAFWNY